jgi:quercetin dioxygenase-like cupin family protein
MDQIPETERTPPAERFADDVIAFDLVSELEKLLQEDNPGQRGHRQVALYKQGHATIALFHFDPGGSLPEHHAPGTVFIQCLTGEIRVSVSGEPKPLRRGGLLVLAPGVRHDVRATEASTMLLTVCMEQK